jgi:phage terminase large subunit GpA-like protein
VMLDTLAHDVELPAADDVICDAWSRAWAFPEPMEVSEWADEYRKIAGGAGAEPGQWRTERNPAMREIMDCLSEHSPIRIVDWMKPAQFGGTEVGINWACYIAHRGLGSMIVAQPIKELARAWSTGKFEPAMTLMPEVLEKFDGYNTLEKTYPGGTLNVIWANSPNQTRQRSVQYIFADEVDEYPLNQDGQGSSLDRIEARANSFGNRKKIYHACTPTTFGLSNIHRGYLAGDQRKYMVPCPHCGKHQELIEENLLEEGAFMCAAGCGQVIEERHKTEMFRERCAEHPNGAYWKATNPSADPIHRSYHCWAAYAPFGLGLTWKQIAEMRAAARLDPSKLITYTNLVLAQPYKGERQTQDSKVVESRAEAGTHRGVVPPGSLVLVAGVDCAHDRFEIQVVGFGRGQRARIVDYAVIDGDPSKPDGYGDLDKFLQRSYEKVGSRAQMPIRAVAIDGGNWTEQVAQFVKHLVGESGQPRIVRAGGDYEQQKIYLVRGRAEKKSDRAVYRPSKTEVNHRERTTARSVGVWGVGTSVLKHIIYGRLGADDRARQIAQRNDEAEDLTLRMIRFPGGRGEKPDPLHPDPGALPASYYEGLTIEYFDAHAKQWVKPRGKANEPLDTLVYALWAALSPAIKIDAIREHEWKALEDRYEPTQDLFAPARAPLSPPPTKVVVPPTVQVPQSGNVPYGTSSVSSEFGSSDWSRRV